MVPYDSYNYHQYWQGREYENQAEKIALKKLLVKIPNKGSLIDIGGGFGRLSNVYLPTFKHCLLVDPSEKLLKIAQKNFKEFKNIEFQKGMGERLPADEASFDVALMVRVVHHLYEPREALREASRVLKPGGFLILELANKIHFRARLRAWLKADFVFSSDLKPIDQRSLLSIKEDKIPMLNHHPKMIEKSLSQAGFEIVDQLSVSNLRSPFLKKILPMRLLLSLESVCQKPLAVCNFGPSLFLLCQKST